MTRQERIKRLKELLKYENDKIITKNKDIILLYINNKSTREIAEQTNTTHQNISLKIRALLNHKVKEQKKTKKQIKIDKQSKIEYIKQNYLKLLITKQSYNGDSEQFDFAYWLKDFYNNVLVSGGITPYQKNENETTENAILRIDYRIQEILKEQSKNILIEYYY